MYNLNNLKIYGNYILPDLDNEYQILVRKDSGNIVKKVKYSKEDWIGNTYYMPFYFDVRKLEVSFKGINYIVFYSKSNNTFNEIHYRVLSLLAGFECFTTAPQKYFCPDIMLEKTNYHKLNFNKFPFLTAFGFGYRVVSPQEVMSYNKEWLKVNMPFLWKQVKGKKLSSKKDIKGWDWIDKIKIELHKFD